MDNMIEWLIEHKYADNAFSAAGMANGLKLNGRSREEAEKRAALYRKWRPTHKSAVKSWQAFELVTKAPWLNPDDYPDRQMDLPTPVCKECDSEIMQDNYCMRGHWCGEPVVKEAAQ